MFDRQRIVLVDAVLQRGRQLLPGHGIRALDAGEQGLGHAVVGRVGHLGLHGAGETERGPTECPGSVRSAAQAARGAQKQDELRHRLADLPRPVGGQGQLTWTPVEQERPDVAVADRFQWRPRPRRQERLGMAGEDVGIVRAALVEPVCELVDQHITSVVYRADTSIRPLRSRRPGPTDPTRPPHEMSIAGGIADNALDYLTRQ